MNEIEITQQYPFQFKQVDRPEGVHLSDIIKALTRKLFPKEYYDESKLGVMELERLKLQWEAGLIWEDALALGLGTRHAPRWEPRRTQEGIWLSPDGVSIDQDRGHNVIHEYKYTSMKSDKTPKTITRWQWQTKAYCLHLGAMEALFHVFYARGDYKPPFMPEYKVWRCEYTPQELIDNWTMIVNFAKSKQLI
jgi:hypothetical protein